MLSGEQVFFKYSDNKILSVSIGRTAKNARSDCDIGESVQININLLVKCVKTAKVEF